MTATLPQVPALERAPVDWERHRGNGSPKILPPPGETWRNDRGRKIGHRYYTRTTTYADALSEQYNLTLWKIRRVLLGMGRRPDYVRLAAALTAEDRDRDALDELGEKAIEAAGPNAADLGTALHALFERIDYGEPLGDVPEEVLPDVAAYEALTDGVLRHVLREQRVVCDELECAGTPDTIAHVAEPCPAGCGPDVLHVGDSKTGSIRYPGKMSTQLAIYSRSARYNPETGERTPLEVCRRWGFIVHSPVETGRAALFWLDLEHGWRGAELCGPVRQWRKAKADDILRPFATVAPVQITAEGEVTRVEPRLASTNVKAPGEPTELAEPTEITLEPPRGPHEAPEPDGSELVDEPVTVAEVVVHDSGWVEVVGDPQPATAGPLGAARCPSLELSLDPGARQCERVAGHSGACEFPTPVTPAERCEHGLLIGQCAAPSCRPDLAHLGDDGMERDESTELPGAVVLTSPEDGTSGMLIGPADRLAGFVRPEAVAWPGADDAEPEQLVNGLPVRESQVQPERDRAVDDALRDRGDPLVDEILRCVTTRDLELLSSQRWREWSQPHRDLAVEVHDRLEAAERAAKPRAAFEAALAAATRRGQLDELMRVSAGQPWLDDALVDAATARWQELPA